MQKRKEFTIKDIGIYISIATAVLYCCCKPLHFYLYGGASWYHAFIYMLMHSNLWHLLCNIWMFLTIIFYYKPSVARVFVAYIVAVVFGFIAIKYYTGQPIVGMSAWIYALLGRYAISDNIVRDVRYNAYVGLSIVIGLAFPSVSVLTHAVCYYMGMIIALTSEPLFTTSNKQKYV